MRRWFVALAIVAALAGGAGLILTRPSVTAPTELNGLVPDLAQGEVVFYAAGCAACHSAPGAEKEDRLVLSGGRRFETPFGTFVAPNISSDPEHGIGNWSSVDLANALIHGTSPSRQHYYPAFPYASYSRIKMQDVVSLHAFLKTLPANSAPSAPHEIGFPFNIRLALGGWKLLFLDPDWVVDRELTAEQERGRYLVEALGHCGECHTRRNALGGMVLSEWLQGAPNPNGRGRIPGLTPDQLKWSEADIAEYLKSGFTPDYDSAGGEMVEVIENTSRLSDADRLAIAKYLKIIPGASAVD
ncbi:gluconate 2-dehydrogenase cytochrome c subunit [Ruegeria lacuscaerulensis ITI-1157]|nr:gluconate 2-dehydrogenase cytochrome c subunit [Ruegeria lacuscaerulensis ITI-1157]SHI71687.1 Cytochrome c, mono-and diheme variants [Ruegeria lacuscaerulensis ITI-1157]